MELTPRTGPPTGDVDAPTRRRRRSLPAVIMVVAVLAVGGFVVANALGTATTFYRNVDEAVAARDELGTKRFRLQGTVVPGTIVQTGDGVEFDVAFNGVELPVRHVGDPPQMFRETEAVLLEGRFNAEGTAYESDLMIIKHSEVYEEKQGERLRDAEEGGRVPVSTIVGEVAP